MRGHRPESDPPRRQDRPEDLEAADVHVLAIYVQQNVRGLDMDRYDDDPSYPTGPPRVVRYGTTLVALERRAFEETRGLMGC